MELDLELTLTIALTVVAMDEGLSRVERALERIRSSNDRALGERRGEGWS